MFQNNRLHIIPSRRLTLLVLGVFLAALCALYFAQLELWQRLALSLTILLYGVYVGWTKLMLRSPRAVHSLQCSGEDVFVICADGSEHKVEVAEDSRIFASFVLLRLLPVGSGASIYVPLFSDSCDANALRRLRVRLRCQFSIDSSDNYPA